jgi:hypothetical protein
MMRNLLVADEQACEQTAELLQPPGSERQRGGWLVEHFRWYRRLSPWAFCWRITIEGLVIGIAFGIAASAFGAPDRDFKMSMEKLFIFAVFVAPVIETLLLQALPVFVVRLCRGGFTLQVLFATIAFAAAHLSEGVAAFIAAGMVGGFYFSFTYAHWRERSRWTAFWVTALGHSLHNLVCVLLMMMV